MYYKQLSKEQLVEQLEGLKAEYEKIKGMDMHLDMSRGKPGADQLDLSLNMFDVFHKGTDFVARGGVDTRNYGVVDGISEAKNMMAEVIGTNPENVIVFGNSSLNIMYDTISRSYTFGVMGETPWCKLEKVKWLCPVPGYDRHFAITELFGIEMINIPMDENGPDMDMVEKLVAEDEAVKGIWCVPKYSNPSGISYSDEVVKRMANLKPAAKDFRIYWDNAYAIHHLYEETKRQDQILDIIGECEKAGNPDMVFEFVSTSKITFPGAGVAAMASSVANLDFIRKYMSIQTIGHDKINQYRHVQYFKDFDGLMKHMMKHASKMRPKFEAVENELKEELGDNDIAAWTIPNGGYFISYSVLDGCAKKIVGMCKDAGLVLTGAGAPYPYGIDPKDENIRIAPSFATPEELKEASHILIVCTKIAAIEKILETK